jgi:hypothetical protein
MASILIIDGQIRKNSHILIPRWRLTEAIRRLLAKALEKPADPGSIAAEDLNASNDE